MVSVIFVEPESPGNIGSIARCMKNFGADQLILVNPCPLDGAWKMAMRAEDILKKAVIVSKLADAIDMVDISVATTSQCAGVIRKAVEPDALKLYSGNLGIVIGRESRGLSTKEIEKCDIVVSIPTSEEYPVLNAASACCILLYEVSKNKKKGLEKSGRAQREKILEELDRIADMIERRDHRKRIWRIILKRVLSKAFPTERETTVLLGFFRRIRKVLTVSE
ncbi:MAG: TrmJ/YjtD family RNA methyltransferase [Theionarchaea archaeon]|nr:TrmJ/YjtD family RNA methyltransferase [Theionarchaea archaeon]